MRALMTDVLRDRRLMSRISLRQRGVERASDVPRNHHVAEASRHKKVDRGKGIDHPNGVRVRNPHAWARMTSTSWLFNSARSSSDIPRPQHRDPEPGMMNSLGVPWAASHAARRYRRPPHPPSSARPPPCPKKRDAHLRSRHPGDSWKTAPKHAGRSAAWTPAGSLRAHANHAPHEGGRRNAPLEG